MQGKVFLASGAWAALCRTAKAALSRPVCSSPGMLLRAASQYAT